MKHILMYLIHGEDLGKRLFLGLTAVGALIAHGGPPENAQGWALCFLAFLTGTSSKSEKQAQKRGGKLP